MHNELTQKDLQLMREELDYRRVQLRPKLLEAVKEARAFGDLSENFEYKAAKQEKNRNESRIRFLENMIKTAVVIADHLRGGHGGIVRPGDGLPGGGRRDRGVPDRHHHAPGCPPRPGEQGVPHGKGPAGPQGGGPA